MKTFLKIILVTVLAVCLLPITSQAAEKVTFQTEDGTVQIDKNPEKIIAFDLGTLDTLNVLGATDRVIGGPELNIFPQHLKDVYAEIENVGGMKEPDLEKINALQPDVIFISGRQADFAEELGKIAPIVYVPSDDENQWTIFKDHILSLGELVDASERANEEIEALESSMATIHEQAEGLTAAFVMLNEGTLSVYGPGSRYHLVYDELGFTPLSEATEASTHGQQITYEYLGKEDPAVIFLLDRQSALGEPHEETDLHQNDLVQKTQASQEDRIVSVQADAWYLSAGGIETLKIMLEDVQSVFK